MSRSVLALVGVLVAAGVIAAVLLLGGKKKDAGPVASGPTVSGTASPGDTPSTSAGGAGPSLPQVGQAVAVDTDQGSNPRDYVVGDIRIRDHRAGDNKPLDVPPNVHPAEGPSIPSTLTHEISQKVKTVMMDCAKADLPPDVRGDKPRLEGQISISIKAHSVTINKSTMVLRNVTEGAAADAMKSCVESKSIGLTNPAPDEVGDLDDYTINLSYAIP